MFRDLSGDAMLALTPLLHAHSLDTGREEALKPTEELTVPLVKLVFNDVAHCHRGIQTHTLPYLNNRRYDYHHAFSQDGRLLLTYDHEHFRLWETESFAELGRLNVYDDMFYLFCADVEFVDGGSDRFIAFFADGPFIMGQITELPNAEGLVEMRVTLMASAKLMLNTNLGTKRCILKYLCCNGSFAAFEHEEQGEKRQRTVCLIHFAAEDIRWVYIPLEADCQSGEDYGTYLSANRLLRIEAVETRGRLKTRVRLWPEIDIWTRGHQRCAVLQGTDGRFAGDGAHIATWANAAAADDCPQYRIYLYKTAEVTKACRWVADEVKLSPCQVVSLDDGIVVYYAQLIPPPSGPLSSPTGPSHLVLLCDTPWSTTGQVFLMDVEQGSYEYELDTEHNYQEDVPPRGASGRRWFHRNGPFCVTSDGRWLFYGRPGRTVGSLMSLERRLRICEVEQHCPHSASEPAFRFDPCGQRISVQLEGGLVIAEPPMLQATPLASKWPVNVTDNAYRVLEFLRLFDGWLFQCFLDDDLENDDLMETPLWQWLVEDATLALLNEAVVELGTHRVRHIVFSEDAKWIAVVLRERPVTVRFWRLDDVKQSGSLKIAACAHTMTGTGTFGDESTSSFALFHDHERDKTFVLVNKDGHEVHLSWMDVKSFTVVATKRLWIKNLAPLKRISATKKGKLYLTEATGEMHVFNLNARALCETVSLGQRRNPSSLRRASLEWNFVYMASSSETDEGEDIFGFDFSKRQLITAAEKKPLEAPSRARKSLGSYDYGYLVWMTATRAMVYCRDPESSFKLALYDITGEVAVQIVEIEGRRLPSFAESFASLGSVEWKRDTAEPTAEELRAFCACFLLAWRRLVPHQRHLSLLDVRPSRSNLSRFLKSFGPNLLNARTHLRDQSFLHHTILTRGFSLGRELLAYARAQKIALDVAWGGADLLEWAMGERCQSCMNLAIGQLLNRGASLAASAHVFHRHFVQLVIGSPFILEKALKENEFSHTLGQFSVPVGVFEDSKTGVIVQTSNNAFSWEATAVEAKWYWKRLSRVMNERLQTAKGTRMVAVSKFVLIENIARVGMRGILRPMLMHGVSVELFATDVVKWTIQYKWETFWRKRFLRDTCRYLVLLGSFSCYAFLLAKDEEDHGPCLLHDTAVDAFLLVIMAISLFDLVGEYRQMRRYRRDCREGWRYYFSLVWNWIELLSIALLLVVIPALHLAASLDEKYMKALSGAAAMECILLWFKVLYYAQPFRSTGSLVTLIRRVLLDIAFFMFLAFVVMTGFSFAFYLVFQASHQPESSFGSLPRSFETLFYAILGDFDLDVYHSGGNLSWLSTVLFCFYMMIETIVLLNLLIAIMGDTFDKVKLTEEAEIMKCRAIVIDDGEAALMDKEILEMEKQIGKYLHVLMPLDKNVAASSEDYAWQGRVRAFESRINEAMAQTEARTAEIVESATKETTELRRDVGQLYERTGEMHRETLQRVAAQGDAMKEEMDRLRAVLDHLTSSLGDA